MKKSKDLYRQVLDSLNDGVYTIDLNRKITFWNRAAETISGYTATDVIGKHCHSGILRHVDEAGHSLCKGGCPLILAMRDKREHLREALLHHKDGHRIPVLIRTLPIFNKKGAVTGATEVFTETSSRTSLEERIQRLKAIALADPLTKLANRRYLESALKARIEETKRYGWKSAIIFMDIDNFKAVNDTWGHMTGDKVLRMVARNLLTNSRSFDVVGRWGGDEFIAICENVSLRQARLLAERYRMLVESSSVAHNRGRLHLTISAGATLVQNTDSIRSLLARVDQLMYRSKLSGKNSITVDG